MSIRSAFLTVFGFLAVGGVVGTAAGYAIGRHFPDALRAQFRSMREDGLDPVHVGVGIGLPQGMMLGALAGVAVVAILAWQSARTNPKSSSV